MTRTKVGLATALLLLVSACTTADQTSQPSTTPMLPPAGSIDPAYASKLSSEADSTSSTVASTEITHGAVTTSSSLATMPSPIEGSTAEVLGSTGLPSGELPIGEGTFRISVADFITGNDRVNAEAAASLVQKAIVLRDVLLHNGSDVTLDHQMEDFLTGQALTVLQSSLDRIRSDNLVVEGWTSAAIHAVASTDGVTTVEVCHDLTTVRMTEPTGVSRNLPLGQRGTYSVAPYDGGLLISVLEYDSSEFVACS